MINKVELINKAIFIRKRLGEDESSPIDIFKLVQSIDNLSIIFYPLNKNISGVCYKGEKSSVIAINSDMSIGRQRFSLAHELYHLYYDKSASSSVSLLNIGEGDEIERNADQFASYFLVPGPTLYEKVDKIGRDNLDIENIIKLEQYFGVSHKAMLYRLVDEGFIDFQTAKSMEYGVVSIAARLGYDTSIYYPSSPDKKMGVLGYYISSADKLLDSGLISRGKYEELLLDAFRDDIVYGMNECEARLD